MDGIRELYQEVILDHNKNPRNFRVVPDANRAQEGDNPLCGDQIKLFLRLDGDRIADIGFQGSGCAISKSSSSLMTEMVKGRTQAEALALFERFHKLVTSKEGDADTSGLGKLAVFSGIHEFPARVKCASLSWHTLEAALQGQVKDGETVVTTEE